MNGKNVLITGASRGIGHACALAFAKRGCNVALNCLKNLDALHRTEELAAAYGVRTVSVPADVGSFEAVSAMFRQIKQSLGHVDILVNNAGISYVGLLTDMTPDEWNRILAVNLSSVFHCCRLAVPSMVSRKSGAIINISSVWGVSGASCEAAYSASKGGMNALTQALAKELAPSGIRVNAIACGAVDTDMNRCFSEEELNALADEIPAGRLAAPEEVAELAADLALSHPYLTGQIIRLDGGWI